MGDMHAQIRLENVALHLTLNEKGRTMHFSPVTVIFPHTKFNIIPAIPKVYQYALTWTDTLTNRHDSRFHRQSII